MSLHLQLANPLWEAQEVGGGSGDSARDSTAARMAELACVVCVALDDWILMMSLWKGIHVSCLVWLMEADADAWVLLWSPMEVL